MRVTSSGWWVVELKTVRIKNLIKIKYIVYELINAHGKRNQLANITRNL